LFEPFRAIVFDLDGTIVDTAPDLHDQLRITLADFDRPCPPLAEVRAMVGDGARALIERGFTATGGWPESADPDQLYGSFLARYTADPLRLSRPFEGLEALLDELCAAGLRLAICTNKPQAPTRGILDGLGLARHFEVVVGGDVLPIRKPDPGHLAAVLDGLGVTAAESIMVGDSANDVLAARGVGLPSVVVSFGYTRVPAAELGADLLIDRLDQLPGALRRLARTMPSGPAEGRTGDPRRAAGPDDRPEPRVGSVKRTRHGRSSS